MGQLHVIKGAYPGLSQIDKTLPVATGQSGIVRGSLIYEDAGEFKLAGTAQKGSATSPGAYLYIALMDQTDLTAGMAGTLGTGATTGKATISGLAISMPMEIETDQIATANYTVGQFLTVGASGKWAAHVTTETAYGQVTKGNTVRWANDAVAVSGWRTGNSVTVIRIRTMYIPNLVTA